MQARKLTGGTITVGATAAALSATSAVLDVVIRIYTASAVTNPMTITMEDTTTAQFPKDVTIELKSVDPSKILVSGEVGYKVGWIGLTPGLTM